MAKPIEKCEAQKIFSTNMRALRKARGMTQEHLAELAELHTNYISSCERGERNISICNIAKIARALGVTMCELVAAPAESSGEQAANSQ